MTISLPSLTFTLKVKLGRDIVIPTFGLKVKVTVALFFSINFVIALAPTFIDGI